MLGIIIGILYCVIGIGLVFTILGDVIIKYMIDGDHDLNDVFYEYAMFVVNNKFFNAVFEKRIFVLIIFDMAMILWPVTFAIIMIMRNKNKKKLQYSTEINFEEEES